MDLSTQIIKEFRIQESQKKALGRLKLQTIKDLLYHFPNRYGDTAKIANINNLEKGDDVTIYGRLTKLKTGKTFHGNMSKATGILEDDTGQITVTWFRQPYLAKMLRDGEVVKATGKITEHNGKLTLNNPQVEKAGVIPIGVGDSLFGGNNEHTLFPIYPESKGITSNWFYHTIQKIFKSGILENINDPIPDEILKKYNLPKLGTALIWIHAPQKQSDALAARKRFAFEEVLYIQLKKNIDRKERDDKKAFIIDPNKKDVDDFIKAFPFKLTSSQDKAIKDIYTDFKNPRPMSRLLEGDVGSGKTAVAAVAVYASTMTLPDESKDFGHLQTAYMVPTEILAKQHFENFIQFFEGRKINIGLITGSGCYKFPSKVNKAKATKISRAQLLKWVENGEIPIVIGTHALIYKSVKFKNLALVIIDEQHRFGTSQRQNLMRKDEFAPHLLSMTATPIPRTLALTIYGDLDITLLDQMPTGRKPIITELVLPTKRDEKYEEIKRQLEQGRQLYVICPRIDEPDPAKENALNVKSVRAEAERLKRDIFKDYKIDILHSKMTPDEKDLVMKRFEKGETDILVATSVVEVGVNVPNATMIIIEGAERFGLSQLHQLRGRVIRSNHQAYAYIFSDTKSDKSIDRLRALKTSKNGFELSEFDLQFRGAGELYGKKQWGITDIGMEAIKNIKMVEAARSEAKAMVSSGALPELIKAEIENRREIHFE